MRGRLTIVVIGTFMLSIALIVFLIGMSGMLKDKHNSFLRLFPSLPMRESKSFDLKFNSYYLAGSTAHRAYLANYVSPLHLLVIDILRSDTQHVSLKVKGIMDQKFWAVRVKVDSPDFFVADGAVPRIYKGSVKNWTADRFAYDQEYFLDYELMKSGSIAITSLNKSGNQSMLGMISTDSPHYQFKRDLLVKQVDGIFCVGGTMHFDRDLNRLVYVYFYRNQYLVMDSTLRLVGKGNTIDTTTVAKIKIAGIESSNSRTMAAPPLMVNCKSAVYRDWLFVDSRLLARNEHPDALKEARVIDVYSIAQRRYRFSFYVFHLNGKEKMKEFRVCGNRFIALFDTHLQLFDLTPEYFPLDGHAPSE